MRLATPPGARLRLVIGVDRVTGVLTGVFPPEDAPATRAHIVEPIARLMTDRLPAMKRRVHAQFMDYWLHGTGQIPQTGIF